MAVQDLALIGVENEDDGSIGLARWGGSGGGSDGQWWRRRVAELALAPCRWRDGTQRRSPVRRINSKTSRRAPGSARDSLPWADWDYSFRHFGCAIHFPLQALGLELLLT